MTDRELIHLITDYAYLKRRLERVSSKLKEELEERERHEQIQLRAEEKRLYESTRTSKKGSGRTMGIKAEE